VFGMEKKTSVIRLEEAIVHLESALLDIVGLDAKICLYADLHDKKSRYRQPLNPMYKGYVTHTLGALGIEHEEQDGILDSEERIVFRLGEFRADLVFERDEVSKLKVLEKKKEEIEKQIAELQPKEVFLEDDIQLEETMKEDTRSEEYISSFGLRRTEGI
jgi:hypothetical protein